jgi:hypothetical protein
LFKESSKILSFLCYSLLRSADLGLRMTSVFHSGVVRVTFSGTKSDPFRSLRADTSRRYLQESGSVSACGSEDFLHVPSSDVTYVSSLSLILLFFELLLFIIL